MMSLMGSTERQRSREFDDFCATEYPRLVGAVGLFCGDRHVAEEVAQEALLRAFLRWSAVSGMDYPSAWVQRVAFNLATSHFRRVAMRRRRDPPVVLVEHHDPDSTSAMAVREALQALRPRARMAVVLRYYLDYSVAQTAATMNLRENTVKTLVRRGLAEMAPLLAVDSEVEAVPDA